jgi:hypothetical protein
MKMKWNTSLTQARQSQHVHILSSVLELCYYMCSSGIQVELNIEKPSAMVNLGGLMAQSPGRFTLFNLYRIEIR